MKSKTRNITWLTRKSKSWQVAVSLLCQLTGLGEAIRSWWPADIHPTFKACFKGSLRKALRWNSSILLWQPSWAPPVTRRRISRDCRHSERRRLSKGGQEWWRWREQTEAKTEVTLRELRDGRKGKQRWRKIWYFLPSGINCVSKNVEMLLKRGIKDTKRKFKEKRGFLKLPHKHPS